MSITAAQRRNLRPDQFGDPANRAYPVDTRGRAIAAKSRASEMEHKGLMSAAKEAGIDARANRALANKRG